MKLQQLSVFLENRRGELQQTTQVLADAGINIATLSLADTEQFGILRLIVRDWEQAKAALERADWVVNLTEVVAVEVTDQPGGLAEVLKVVEDADINIEYMYAFTFRRNDRAVLVFRFEDPDAAIKVIQDAGLSVLGHVELYEDQD